MRIFCASERVGDILSIVTSLVQCTVVQKWILLRRTKSLLELFEYLLEAAELSLRLCAGPLYLLHRFGHALDYRREIRHIEPQRERDKNHDVQDEFYNAAPKRIATHAAEHAVVFFYQPICLF